MAAKDTTGVRVKALVHEAPRILRVVLEDPAGRPLPAVSAGAHVDLHLPGGYVRQYSLCGDPVDRTRYQIAVLREVDGRGGSRAVHERVRPGDLLTMSAPRNFFPLAAHAGHHLLLAGGIGVTPMVAMIASLEAAGASWCLHYCTRSRAESAFLDRLEPLVAAGKVHLHHDGGDPGRGLDLAATLTGGAPGTHVYYCGPPGFMAAAAAATAHWPRDRVHCEHFTAGTGSAGDRAGPDTPFRIRLAGSGAELEVPAGRSIVDVLRENGHYVDTSCEDGFCGTCLTPYLEGEPEHRDSVLDDEDRARYVLICCARSRSPVLVLDL